MKKMRKNTKIMPSQGLKRLHIYSTQSQQPVLPITKLSTILLHLLSADIKQRKVANLESKHSHSVITGDWGSADFQTTSLPPRPLIVTCGRTLQTMSWIFKKTKKMAVWAVEASTAELLHPYSYIYLIRIKEGKHKINTQNVPYKCVCGCVSRYFGLRMSQCPCRVLECILACVCQCLLLRPQSWTSRLSGFMSGSCRSPSPCVWCGTVCVSAYDTVSSSTGSLTSAEQREHRGGIQYDK